ncbi:MAG: hypothetical protein DWQ47_01390 [Acidobacteria bacterium]|nr:MAG: hypothetical protein DWQ32_11850 [Acidobacteriota bacterium]REK04154.1 MAG: hypothetical protein DWQ38_01375 [Acidobacteriota bacterium]REK15316.1 MAG: hypothetical protein DWQ43_17540 [Acidobacteriota bacterium]REK46406.1 MAG: hypothetical protein DWQ47_01390 [Acidobacteriota bacterium]
MAEHEWNSKTRTDLVIEVWEKLDCESVGADEVSAIETVVAEVFGENACDSPIVIARLLADEGAVLRHSEILEMDVRRRLESPYDAMFRNLLNYSSFALAERSLRNMENLRRKFASEVDKQGLLLLRELVLRSKDEVLELEREDPENRNYYREINEWFSIWLQSSEIFESWVRVRRSSAAFREAFPDKGTENDA